MSYLTLAFSGTHGSGKTTLAKLIATKTGAQFLPSNAGEVHRQFGVTASENIPFNLRIEIQIAILNDWEEAVAAGLEKGPVVTDRSPLDFAAYLLAEVPRDLDERLSASANHFIEHCMKRCIELSPILFCHPHEAILGPRGKDKAPAGNKSYAQLVHFLMLGLLFNTSTPFLSLGDPDLKKRVLSVTSYLSDRFDQQSQETIQERAKPWIAPGYH